MLALAHTWCRRLPAHSYDEIAAQLDVSWLTVNRQLVRARAAVRAARQAG
jgi:DNA-directed RNA polymerase specialized sigma24 family protein